MEKSVKILAFILFSTLGFIGILHHEIWLDEAHHFVLSRDSNTLSNLYFNNRYEGHPLLWNFLLWLLCKIIPSVFAMQFLHLAIATMSAAMVLWYAPFKLYQKVLLCFSYFLFYEYTVISRNYAVSVLLIFVCIIQITRSKKNYNLIFLLLALLANTHLFSLVISVSIFIYFISENEVRKELLQHKKYFPMLLVYFLALLFAISFAKVPQDHFMLSYNSEAWLSAKRIGKAFSICWKSLFHLQPFNEFNLWNKNWLIEFNKNLATTAAIIVWFVPLFMFKENKKIIVLFFFISLCICAFTFLSPLIVAVRHSGFVFIAFVISYWLLIASKKGVQEKKSEFIFGVILFQLCLASFVIYKHDYNYPFSSAKKTSVYVQKIASNHEIQIICQNTAMPVISAYTGNKYIEINSFTEVSFCHWNNHPFLLNQMQVHLQLIKYFETQKSSEVYYITQIQLDLEGLANNEMLKYSLKNSFTNSIVKQQNYYVYLVEKLKPKANTL